MATATFAEHSHQYEVGGVAVPSVTQVLTLAGIDDVSKIPAHILNRAAEIGTAVHEACEFLDQDDLDLDSLDPLIHGYVLGYQRFRQEHGFHPIHIEQRGIAANGDLRYGYCVDRSGLVDGAPAVVDIKTSSRAQAKWAIQTAAYSEALKHEGVRLVVHVAKDGSYKLIRHEDPNDFEVWLAALNVAHWKLAHGAKIA